ncbi:MAG: hypothetical protein RLZZ142_543, partial [Verrucomicrobiota bacterium]
LLKSTPSAAGAAVPPTRAAPSSQIPAILAAPP